MRILLLYCYSFSAGTCCFSYDIHTVDDDYYDNPEDYYDIQHDEEDIHTMMLEQIIYCEIMMITTK